MESTVPGAKFHLYHGLTRKFYTLIVGKRTSPITTISNCLARWEKIEGDGERHKNFIGFKAETAGEHLGHGVSAERVLGVEWQPTHLFGASL